MSRNHIHFITCEPWQTTRSGMRAGTQIALYINARLVLCDASFTGQPMAWHSPAVRGSIPPKYFVKA
eukprot:14653894-Alexandrium_andersonii.AAC.1